MNIKEIKEMIKLMNENGLSEFEIEKEGERLHLKKGTAGQQAETILTAQRPDYPVSPKEIPQVSRESRRKIVEIKAPMVGTFYRAPAPDVSPFVEVGSEINIGQVVCILEAMKLMNEIKSEVKGKVVEVCIENAQPAEFGQALFRVEPV